MSVDMEPQMGVGTAQAGAHQEVDEGLRALAPQPQPTKFLGIGSGLVAAGALAAGMFAATDPALAYTVAGGGAGVSTASLVVAERARQRAEIADHFTEQICPVMMIRPRPSRAAVKLSRWRGGFIGLPQQVQLTYHARVVPDPEWLKSLAEVASVSLGAKYKVEAHLPRKRRVVLGAVGAEQVEKTDPTVERASRVVRDLLGESARVKVELNDDGDATRIEVAHEQGSNMAMASKRLRVERVLATRVPGDWVPEWNLVEDTVVFSAREPMPSLVLPPPEHSPLVRTHADYRDFQIPLGVDEDGEQLSWHPRKQPHMVVVGTTGSGKTVVEQNVVQRLTQAGWKVWVIDGKRIEFIGLRDWPNVERLASRIEHQVKLIEDAHDLMNERYALIEAGKATSADFEPVALIVDEATTLLEAADDWWAEVKPKGGSSKSAVLKRLGNIGRLGRSAKIHMLIGLQRADTRFISGEFRDNLGMRVAMSRLSPDGAKMMWDSYVVGTTIPRHIKGRGMALNSAGVPVMIQTIYAPNPDPGSDDYDPQRVAAVRPREVVHKKMLVEILEPVTVGLDGAENPTSYADYMDARVYEAPDQPQVQPATAPAASAAVPAGALAALQSLNTAPASAAVEERPTGRPSPAVLADPSRPVIAERKHVPYVPDDEQDLFEGYGEPVESPAEELQAGDLIQIDPDSETWAVLAEDPQEDEAGIYLEYIERDTGEAGGISVAATEMLPTRHIEHEES